MDVLNPLYPLHIHEVGNPTSRDFASVTDAFFFIFGFPQKPGFKKEKCTPRMVTGQPVQGKPSRRSFVLIGTSVLMLHYYDSGLSVHGMMKIWGWVKSHRKHRNFQGMNIASQPWLYTSATLW